MWKKITTKLPLSFPPAVGSVHWMRIYEPPPRTRKQVGSARAPQYTCNISRSEYRFYEHEVESVSDTDLLTAFGTTHDLMPQTKDSFASVKHFFEADSAIRVVYEQALADGKGITEALTLALCLDDGADPNFDKLFFFAPVEDGTNA